MIHFKVIRYQIVGVLTILFSLLWAENGTSQDFGYEEIGAQQGFTNAEVKCMFQDSKSNMWFGTYGSGLFKYDGVAFQRFTMSEGLPSNNVFSINEGSDGEILIGFDTYPFVIYHENQFFHIFADSSDMTNKYRCTQINSHPDSSKRLIVGLNNKIYDYKRGKLIPYEVDYSVAHGIRTAVRSAALNEDFLWLGIDRHLSITNMKTGESINDIEGIKEVSDSPIFYDIHIVENNVAYVATNIGLGIINDPSNPQFKLLDSNAVFFEIVEQNGLIYSCSAKGIKIFDGENLVETLFPDFPIIKMYFDNQNNLWAYIYSRGLIKLSNRNYKHYFKDVGDIYSYTISDTMPTYVGIRNDGIYGVNEDFSLDKAYRTKHTFQMEFVNDENTLYYINMNENNIGKIKRDGDDFTHEFLSVPSSSTKNCFAISGDKLLVGSWSNGVFVVDQDSLDKKQYYDIKNSNISDSWIKHIYPYGDEFLIGTHTGLNALPKNEIFPLDLPEEISAYTFEKVAIDHKKNLWTITSNGIYILGLNWKSNSLTDISLNRVLKIKHREIVNLTDINDILIHDKVCFIGTSSGLYTIDLEVLYEEGQYLIRSFGISEGLYDSNVSNLRCDDLGRLWFSTPSCVTRFDHKGSHSERNDLPLFLDEIKVSDYDNNTSKRYANRTSVISLDHNENAVFLKFRAVNLKSPSKVKYKYRLLGLSDYWSEETTENEVLYTSLNPGSYEFQFNAKNENGRWNREVFTFQFEITPPFWQTLWFFLLTGVFLILSVFSLIRLRLRNLQNQQKVLKQLVTEKTSVIEQERNKLLKTNKELKVAKLRAEESEQSKERFFANMSHEIRTPLNAISGITKLLLQNNPSKKEEKHLNIIRHSSDNLMVIINDILDLTKLKEQKLRIEHIDFSLTRTLTEVANLFDHKFRRQGNTFEILPGLEKKYALNGDPLRLSQILINLIGNANKFTENGKVELIFDVISEGDIIEIEFRVKDSGIGIAREKFDTIFASFNQENPETTRLYGGTGLGLAITKELVELMNGKIRLESELGVGSEFIFTIPFGKASAPLEPETQRDAIQQNTQSKFSILLVEDNRYNQIVAEETIKSYAPNVKIKVADNGQKALEILEQNAEFDIILMDLFMPELDGYETTKAIRNSTNSSISNIPIIALTANVSPNERAKCEEIGMNGYVVKPFDINELMGLMQELTEADNDRLKFLKNLTGNDPEKTEKYIKLFLKMAPAELKTLEECVDQEEFDPIMQAAHKLKTKTEMMGAAKLLDLICSIEEMAMEKRDLPVIRENMKAANEEFLLVIKELEALI